MIVLSKEIEWIIHSIWSEEISLVEEGSSLDSNSSIEWKFTTQQVESRPVHAIFTPKEVITEVTTQGVTSVTNRVKIHSIFCEYRLQHSIRLCRGGLAHWVVGQMDRQDFGLGMGPDDNKINN